MIGILPFLQRLAIDEFHDDEMFLIRLFDAVDRTDVRIAICWF